ncbi:unnamed protein product [Rotaria sordida]|uniref:Uncharacterized protein n=1 Tax=Rotaria sordida TaxID=392033 RepID=A0A813Y924_9BILA|nr:unnamed protein product [Rotaria sordida]
MKVNVDYLFLDKNDRHRRLRGKLLFKETVEECEEYCEDDTSLTVDKSTWLPTIASESNTNNKVMKCTTFKQKKRKNESKEPAFTGKQMKTNSSIAIVKKSTQIDKTTKNNQQNAFDNQKRQPNENNTNDESESSVSTTKSSIVVDLSNNDSFDNNMSSKCSAHLKQSQQRTKLTGVGRQENNTISNDNIESDDELILPRHIQLELKSNRKRILNLENQLKELKHTSIPFPTTEKSDYLRRVLAVVDMRDELAQTGTINYGQLLGLTNFELLEATGNGRLPWKKIVVSLIQACFKNVDLQYENYTSLRARNKDLIDNISAYVKTVCPTAVFTNTEFSGCITESISSAPLKVEEIKEYKPERIESMDALATTTTEIINGPYPLTKLKYYSFGESILFDSLYTLYLGVFKKFWLSSVIIPTTTSRRFRTIKHIARFKANEFRSLMHHRSTVLLQAMLPKYRRRFALLLMVVNIASKDVIDNYDIILVKGLLHQYVKDWQKIFDLRHMSSNIHSLLHIHESIQYLGPFYICIVLLILKVSIGHDLVYMIHGMTHCGPQLISNLQYYRQAIIDVFKHDYPEKLFYFNERLSPVKIPTTTSRRFRTIKHIVRFKANEFRSLIHHGSTVVLQAMLPKYRQHFALLSAAVNVTSKDIIDNCDIILVKELLHQYVKDWQNIFGLRHMSSNIHSLLHIHKSIQYLDPLYMYSTFNFEGIGHDLVCMIHGMTHYGPQLISNLQYYRQAIIDAFKRNYPGKLFYFNESILSRKLLSK